MIGVFDSGVGGMCAYGELRRLLPGEDLIYLADRKNAPYGNKRPEEILKFTGENIEALISMGAERVLIACCTASTMHSLLPDELRRLSLPIIPPTARLTHDGERILVIATEHTVKSGAFSREIAKYSSASVKEIAMQRLVSLIEWGENTKDACLEIENHCKENSIDTLILGCTHFSHISEDLRHMMPHINILSPAHIGAREIAKRIKTDRGCGLDLYIGKMKGKTKWQITDEEELTTL